MSRFRITFLLHLILIPALAFGALATVSSFDPASPAIAKEGKGKGGEDKGKSKSGKGKSGKHKDKDDRGKKDKKDKGDNGNRGHGKSKDRIEAQAVVYTIGIACDATDSGTACRFTPQVPAGAHKVTHLLIPPEAVCAPVIGGDSRLLEPDPVTGVSGYTSSGGEDGLSLVVDGVAAPGGQAIYWVKVTGDILPASGPALQCAQFQLQAEQTPIPRQTTEPQPTAPVLTPEPEATPEPTTELTDSTGSIVVEVYDCPIATPEADYDWFGQCNRSTDGNRFRLVPAGEDPSNSDQAVTDAGGQARFSLLEPGLYVLTQLERDWCHAKSDGVDEQGNVVVTAGERTTVWIFACLDPEVSPSPIS